MTGAAVATPEAVRRILGGLVGFDTTSHRSNLALIEFVADHLAGHGVKASRVPSPDGGKAGLIATVGPMVAGGVVLSGHTDVVPVAGQAWASDPFTLVEKDGRLYGRGTADMKGFIAVALALVPQFRAAGLRVPIHLALSFDEEVGCLGAPALLARLAAEVPAPAAAIVGEPSEMKVANAHKGIVTFATTVSGRPGHSSAPGRGVNAIAAAARCITFLGGLAAEYAESAAPAGAGGFDPPHATINVGRIEGGAAVNIIAGSCRFEWDCRTLPGTDGEEAARRLARFAEAELLPELRRTAPEAAVVTERTAVVPPLTPRPDSPAERLALALAGEDRPTTTSFASEAGLFQQAGIPAVICGPGSPRQAHQPNEFVTLDDLAACAEFMRRLAGWAAGA